MNSITHMLEDYTLETNTHSLDGWDNTVILVIKGRDMDYTAFLTPEQLTQIRDGIETYLAGKIEEVLA